MIRRKLLALFIKLGKEPTTRNILKYALKYYLNCDIRLGLCTAIIIASKFYNILYTHRLSYYIPEFTNQNAVKYFGGVNNLFWWPLDDWKSRYKFMKWLIKKYE